MIVYYNRNCILHLKNKKVISFPLIILILLSQNIFYGDNSYL